MKKKILLVSQYFWPESFSINDICLELSKKHSIQVLTGKPNYPGGNIFKGYSKNNTVVQNYGKIKIFRVPLVPRKKNSFFNLINNYISFVFNGIYYGRKFKFHEFDHILVYATSPITSVIPAIFLKFKYKKKLTVWVQDLWPESVKATGYIKNSFFIFLISILVKLIYYFTDVILIQSKAFKKKIIKHAYKKKIIYHPNSFKITKTNLKIKKKINDLLINYFCITFAGNLGKAQALDKLIQAASILNEKKIKILIFGNGSEEENLKNMILKKKLKNVLIFDRVSSNVIYKIYKKSKVLFVSLKKNEILDLTIPNKVQSYMAASKPIIGAVSGEAARTIKKNRIGYVCNIKNPEDIKNKIIKIYKLNKKEMNEMSKRSKLCYEKNFNFFKLNKSLINKLA